MPKKDKEVALRQTGEVSTQLSREEMAKNQLAYGKVAGMQTSIVGTLLKFVKGEWLAGQDNDELAEGTKMIVNTDSLMVGWQRWEGARPAEQIMGLTTEAFQPPVRSDLSHTDKNEWEQDDRGQPRDPWQFGNQVLMKDAHDGTLYTFVTTSKGGISALGVLISEVAERHIEGEIDFPIVTLGGDSYPHRNKQFGRIHIPVLEITGWSPAKEWTTDEEKSAKKAKSNGQDARKPAASKSASKPASKSKNVGKKGERELTY